MAFCWKTAHQAPLGGKNDLSRRAFDTPPSRLLNSSSGRAAVTSAHAEEPLSAVEMASRSTLYTTEILRLAASLPEPAVLNRVDGVADERSPTCGSTVRTEVEIDPEGRVVNLSQRVQACAFGQASATLLQAGATERSAADVERATEELTAWLDGLSDDPGAWPGLEALAPARLRKSRHGAILLPFRALLAAMRAARA